LISLWIIGAFFYLSIAGKCLQISLSIIIFACLLFSFIKFQKQFLFLVLLSLTICVYALTYIDPPINNRAWVPEQMFIPLISINKNQITIKNFRNCRYRSNTDFDVHWETKIFDLEKLAGVDFIVEPFADWRGLAHTFLTFSFDDGEHVAISVEIRREQKEVYSVLAGIYWNYEVMYIVGEEKDLIGLRTNIRKDPVYLFPIKANKIQIKKLFLSMLQRAKNLEERPEYYNSLFNTCSTNIARHLKENFDLKLGIDFRLIFPGYADEIAFDLKLIDTDQTLEEARQTFLINNRSQFLDDGKAWSKQIRNYKNIIK
jgi:hypothetical protein